MPDRIETAQIVGLDPDTLEINDTYPGTYGFYVRLSRDPGLEWAAEFEGTYLAATRSAKPPVVFRGDTLCVYFLPAYLSEMGEYLTFLESIVAETNTAAEARNAVLPDDQQVREAFRSQLVALSARYQQQR